MTADADLAAARLDTEDPELAEASGLDADPDLADVPDIDGEPDLADVAFLAPTWLQMTHLLGADLLWIALVLLSARVCLLPVQASVSH